jgi:hypothetical protein
MLDDIVIDTNVLVHASNQAIPFHAAALLLVSVLNDSSTSLCVDEGFHVAEALNQSLIGGEYNQHLIIGMIGYAIVATLANTGRLKQVPRRVPRATAKTVQRLVPRNPRDRTFIHVTINSTEHILVSHDFDDFPGGVRKDLQRQVGVSVIIAEEAAPLIAP